MEGNLFFNGWDPLIRIVFIGTTSYFSLLFMLRAAGKRALSKLNAYDFIITMAIGSILAKIIVDRDISLSEGFAASALLIALQFCMTWACSRIEWVHRLFTPQPVVVFHDGKYNEKAMRSEHISHRDIEAAARKMGLDDLTLVKAVLLSTTGKLDVILKKPRTPVTPAVE